MGTRMHSPKRQSINCSDDGRRERDVQALSIMTNSILWMILNESEIDMRNFNSHSLL
ncbi:MAG: hypothetical protein ACUVTL_09455 [Thermoproteota archaeon]